MDNRLRLPPRPELINSSPLFTPAHMLFIDNCILMGETHDKLYKAILAPNATPGKVRADKSALMATKVAEEYIEKRTRQLLVHFGIEKPSEGEAASVLSSGDIPEDWQSKVKEIAIKKALDGNLDDSKASEIVLKEVLKGQDNDEQPLPAFRFLPETNKDNKFINFTLNLIANNDIVDCCRYCKARALHPEIPDESLYDMPLEEYKELESKAREHVNKYSPELKSDFEKYLESRGVTQK